MRDLLKKENKPCITVFTATYNRQKLLERAYVSLCEQTRKEFVWLIVDDGSTDETQKQVEMWQREADFEIYYVYQENGGKMRAHNRGVQLTETELFVCLDSDDTLTRNAVERLTDSWQGIPAEKKQRYAGMIAYKGRDEEYTLNGELFPEVEADSLTGLEQKGFRGETVLVLRTEILREFLFPEFDGENFVPEAVVYDRIDRKYQYKVIPEIFMVCEYQPDGLTRRIAQLRNDNPRGWLLYYQQRIEQSEKSLLRYKYQVHAVCFAWKLHAPIHEAVPGNTVERLAALPAAVLLRCMRKL